MGNRGGATHRLRRQQRGQAISANCGAGVSVSVSCKEIAMKKVISFVAMSLLLAACGHSPVQPSRVADSTPVSVTYAVTGTVSESTDDGSRAVADATVVVANEGQSLAAST